MDLRSILGHRRELGVLPHELGVNLELDPHSATSEFTRLLGLTTHYGPAVRKCRSKVLSSSIKANDFHSQAFSINMALELGWVALRIVGLTLTIVGSCLKSSGLAKISGVGLELASDTLNLGASRHNYGPKFSRLKNLPATVESGLSVNGCF